ncbi:MAG TPA: prepilin peptidase [Candidatus Hydrogenedentes bacterium]|nr:prepilin peptidase [Candidatus Hydrogenedentota bacterium]
MQESFEALQGFLMMVSFVLGAMVGSFCNVCISRWPSGASVVSPRSRCPKCLNGIAWYDNIPLLSWLALGAKCRHCGLPISWVYPVVEGITAFLFLGVFWKFGVSVATPVYMALCAGMVIVTFQDLADWTIPNEVTLPGIPIGILLGLGGMVLGPDSGLRVTDVFDALAGAALGGGILFALDRITVLLLKKPGMGFGDVKLLAMLGAFLGWKGALGILMLASILGSVVGLAMLGWLRARGKTPAAPPADPASDPPEAIAGGGGDDEEITLEGHYLPFGPYLAVGGLLYLFFGPELIALYFNILQSPAGTPLLP